MSHPLKLVIDTNIWLDYFFNRSDAAVQTIKQTADNPEIDLYYAAVSSKDVFYIASLEAKRLLRSASASSEASQVLAASEIAWECVTVMSELATAVPSDESDLWMARRMRSRHEDYEDNIVAAAAWRTSADFLITNDKQLAAHYPEVAISPSELLQYLQL